MLLREGVNCSQGEALVEVGEQTIMRFAPPRARFLEDQKEIDKKFGVRVKSRIEPFILLFPFDTETLRKIQNIYPLRLLYGDWLVGFRLTFKS